MHTQKTYTIFYSWQSDLNRSRSFIQSTLNLLKRELEKDGSIHVEIDSDTRGVPGAPNIPATIFKKIENADLFVADLSIINSKESGRKTPNPNVLLETGYAIHALGWDRIVLLFDEDFGSIDDQLFDLKQHRLTGFSLRDEKKKEKSRDRLIANITSNLKMLEAKDKKIKKDNKQLLAAVIMRAVTKAWEYYEKSFLQDEPLYSGELLAIGDSQFALLEDVRAALKEDDYFALHQLLHNLKMATLGSEDMGGHEYVQRIIEKYTEPLYREYYGEICQLPLSDIFTEEFVTLFNSIAAEEQKLVYKHERYVDGRLVLKVEENKGEVYSIEEQLLYKAEKGISGQLTGFVTGYEYTGEYVEGKREGNGKEYFRGMDGFSCKGLNGEEECYGTVKCEGIWKNDELMEGTLYGVALYKEDENVFSIITAYDSEKPRFMDEEILKYEVLEERTENCKRYYVGNLKLKNGIYELDDNSVRPLCDEIGGVRNLMCWECNE